MAEPTAAEDLERAKSRIIHESPQHGPILLAEIARLTAPHTKCSASPCDVIAAVNFERDRICSWLARAYPSQVFPQLIDAIHGVDDL